MREKEAGWEGREGVLKEAYHICSVVSHCACLVKLPESSKTSLAPINQYARRMSRLSKMRKIQKSFLYPLQKVERVCETQL